LEFRDLVLDDLQKLPYPPGYVVSTRWAEIIDHAMRAVAEAKDPSEIALFGMHLFDVGLLPADVNWLRGSRARYNQWHSELSAISESALAPPNSIVGIDGVTFSHSLEQAFSYYRGLVAGIGNDHPDVVIEIGSGYGRFVRVLRLAGRSRHFILVDLPGSLLFAFAYLRLHFPDAKMHLVRSPADAYPDMATDFDFIFCPVQYLHHLRPRNVDLLVNTYSLGEMQQGCVDHIMKCIHANLKPRYFYSFNVIFTNKNLHFDTSGNTGEGCDIVLKLDPEWWPETFDLVKTTDNDNWRFTANTVLKRVNTSPAQLVSDLIGAANNEQLNSDRWLGFMYFAALWTSDPKLIERFLEGLRTRQAVDHFTDAPSYDFEAAGEVRFLRHRLRSVPLARPRLPYLN